MLNKISLFLSRVGSSATSSLLSAATRRFSTEFDLSLVSILRPYTLISNKKLLTNSCLLLLSFLGLFIFMVVIYLLFFQVESLREIAGVGWTGTFNSYTNTIRTNMAWREENEPKIAHWLGVSVTAEGYKDTRKMSKISEIELLHPKALNKKY